MFGAKSICDVTFKNTLMKACVGDLQCFVCAAEESKRQFYYFIVVIILQHPSPPIKLLPLAYREMQNTIVSC
jgi:hypothetical protein